MEEGSVLIVTLQSVGSSFIRTDSHNQSFKNACYNVKYPATLSLRGLRTFKI